MGIPMRLSNHRQQLPSTPTTTCCSTADVSYQLSDIRYQISKRRQSVSIPKMLKIKQWGCGIGREIGGSVNPSDE